MGINRFIRRLNRTPAERALDKTLLEAALSYRSDKPEVLTLILKPGEKPIRGLPTRSLYTRLLGKQKTVDFSRKETRISIRIFLRTLFSRRTRRPHINSTGNNINIHHPKPH